MIAPRSKLACYVSTGLFVLLYNSLCCAAVLPGIDVLANQNFDILQNKICCTGSHVAITFKPCFAPDAYINVTSTGVSPHGLIR